MTEFFCRAVVNADKCRVALGHMEEAVRCPLISPGLCASKAFDRNRR
jgi:hypothetical protein